MKISTRGRYAVRILLDIAMHQGNGYVAMKDIARRQQISKKYGDQIGMQLSAEFQAFHPVCCHSDYFKPAVYLVQEFFYAFNYSYFIFNDQYTHVIFP